MQFIPQAQNDRTGYELITGKTPDISEYCDFEFYDGVWYWPHARPPLTKKHRELACWVIVAHQIGSDMCYWLIPRSRKPIADTTVQHVTDKDLRNLKLRKQIEEFNEKLPKQLDNINFVIQGTDDVYLEDI